MIYAVYVSWWNHKLLAIGKLFVSLRTRRCLLMAMKLEWNMGCVSNPELGMFCVAVWEVSRSNLNHTMWSTADCTIKKWFITSDICHGCYQVIVILTSNLNWYSVRSPTLWITRCFASFTVTSLISRGPSNGKMASGDLLSCWNIWETILIQNNTSCDMYIHTIKCRSVYQYMGLQNCT